jgi:hypothetical protein
MANQNANFQSRLRSNLCPSLSVAVAKRRAKTLAPLA